MHYVGHALLVYRPGSVFKDVVRAELSMSLALANVVVIFKLGLSTPARVLY